MGESTEDVVQDQGDISFFLRRVWDATRNSSGFKSWRDAAQSLSRGPVGERGIKNSRPSGLGAEGEEYLLRRQMSMGRIAFMLPESLGGEETLSLPTPRSIKTPRSGQISPSTRRQREPKNDDVGEQTFVDDIEPTSPKAEESRPQQVVSEEEIPEEEPVDDLKKEEADDELIEEATKEPDDEEEEEEEMEERPETCVICLEPFDEDDTTSSELPCRVPSATSLPCACQARVKDPARVHEACLRSWLGACARRSARMQTDEAPTAAPPQSTLTCPLCRAPLSDTVAKSLELAARVRAALKQCPRVFAATPLVPADGVIRCVVKVHDKNPSHALGTVPGGSTGGSKTMCSDASEANDVGSGQCGSAPILLSLYVEGDDSRGIPLLVARAPKVLGSSRLATKFDICFGPRSSDEIDHYTRGGGGGGAPPPPPTTTTTGAPPGTTGGAVAPSTTAASAGTPPSHQTSSYPPRERSAAVLSRNCLGTRWTVTDPATSNASCGKRRCAVDYEANRFANRPRAMHVDLDNCAGAPKKLRSRAPEYSPRLHGFCLDFFGRARLASVRNFQIVDATEDLVPGDEEARCLLLFGRWSSDEFHLDVKHPFSLVDAFAIAVSSFATKIATI